LLGLERVLDDEDIPFTFCFKSLKLGYMNVVDRNKVLSRIKEIEEEDKATPKPILGETSIEDVDDLYQARLEYNWWFDELNTEYKELCAQLGKTDAHLHRNQFQC
jgi:hypothetical protein